LKDIPFSSNTSISIALLLFPPLIFSLHNRSKLSIVLKPRLSESIHLEIFRHPISFKY
jgi:hypothetical protein